MQKIEQIIRIALDEDLGDLGDITSNFTIPFDKRIKFQISNREPIMLCGIDFAVQIFKAVEERLGSESINLKINHQDGDFVDKNSVLMEGEGNARTIFAAERLALNLLQHLSGISTITKKYVDEIKGTKAQILDTRKTIPAFRNLQKYAVKTGGGTNHRMALFDGILIKDNHIIAAGSISNAVRMVRENIDKSENKIPKDILLEVECDNLTQVKEALDSRVQIIMLDNMNIDQIRQAVELIEGKAKIEVSGGVTLSSVKAIADTGIDYISVGALTHSSKAVDMGLDVI
ncbi:MAG: nicotinate-nucleotide pyrophosphorylase (carboxylating) [Rickettsiales bacterium]|jgi:nicotinate-nucleotide pyrophosphorylase (carboxylating)